MPGAIHDVLCAVNAFFLTFPAAIGISLAPYASSLLEDALPFLDQIF